MKLIAALGMVEQKEDGDGDGGISAGPDQFVPPEEMEVDQAQETAVDEKQQNAVDDREAERDDDAGQRTFYIDLKSNTCSDIADGGFGHPIDADGLVGERVLEQANDGSGEGAGDGTAAGDSEKEDDDQRQIEEGETRKRLRQKGLQKNRQQRHEQRNGGGEGVLLEFSAGSVAVDGHFLTSLAALLGSPREE